jgi:hypothetical protein
VPVNGRSLTFEVPSRNDIKELGFQDGLACLREAPLVAIMGAMPSDPPDSQPPEPSEPPPEEPGSASKDLADGLELMLRAARKAVKRVDPNRIEAAGRRAIKSLETLDAKKVGAFGRKAAKNLDPRKIEEVAEEAGKELLNVVERVAERMESIVNASARDSQPPPAKDESAAKEEAAPATDEASADAKPRVRIEDD